MHATDPAYSYHRNPNAIRAQQVSLTLKRDPEYGAPQCMGGQVGVMTTGAELFSAFDAGGRDAGAWEVQDGCEVTRSRRAPTTTTRSARASVTRACER